MKKINELILLSGNDIPFPQGSVTIHQPSLKEIGYLGEEVFFTGCELLKFSKDILENKDKTDLSAYSDFQILMSILSDNSASMQNNVSSSLMVLELIFPLYEVEVSLAGIACKNRETKELCGGIVEQNFTDFKQILKEMFCLDQTTQEQEYNAQGELAKKIAEKFKKRKQQLAALKPKAEKVAIFSRYISILTVGEKKDMNSFMSYTVYQLFDEFQRFQLKMAQDVYLKAKLAGAKDMKEPEDWMKDIHE